MVVFTSNATNNITTADGRVWECWTSNTITCSTTATGDFWAGWNSTGFNSTVYNTSTSVTVTSASSRYWVGWATTREAKQARQAMRKRGILARRKQSEIDERAEQLLLALLNEEEQRDFARYGSLRIVGKKNVYEIGQRHDLVTVMDKKGVPQHNLCLHPSLHYPKLDRLAATLLALRFDEDAVIKRGNFNSLRTREAEHIMARRGHMVA